MIYKFYDKKFSGANNSDGAVTRDLSCTKYINYWKSNYVQPAIRRRITQANYSLKDNNLMGWFSRYEINK